MAIAWQNYENSKSKYIKTVSLNTNSCELRVFTSHKKLNKSIANHASIGLVPTMGSLHEGHLSLIKKALNENEHVIVSIYVNPTQFNQREDFENYPRNVKSDIDMLKIFERILIYIPDDNEIYQKAESKTYDFEGFENILEGEFRPGHFYGVATVIEKLFRLLNPSSAYFGEKDFQQLLLIKILIKKLNLNIKIVGCETIRERDGLAMSSRNKLLSEKDRSIAANIPKILNFAKKEYSSLRLKELRKKVEEKFKDLDGCKLEYFEIIDLSKKSIYLKESMKRIFISVWVGKIRLIDNISI
ncbi:MAG: pantoate--beta-alanine ligase [Bacteroidota bacterium]